MDSIFEKITLYDILGYGFPGFFFLLLVLIEFYGLVPSATIRLLKNHEGLLVASIVVVSHTLGVILSEASKMLTRFVSKNKQLIAGKDIVTRKAIINDINKDIYLRKSLKLALKNSGVLYPGITKESLGYIYSVIQTDSNFSRIHVYASASVMCRNVATASLLGSILLIGRVLNELRLNQTFLIYKSIFAVCLFMCFLLMLGRTKRFEYKKYYYAVNLFVHKYNVHTNDKNEPEAKEETSYEKSSTN